MKNFLLASLVSLSFLLGINSCAHASWSGPVYTVSNRQPANGNGTTTSTTPPSGGGTTDYIDTPVAGTVTAEFTWVHDAPGDTPPNDVYVLQYGYAEWSYPPTLGPPPAGMMRYSKPSFKLADFTSKNRGRLLLVQAGGGGGANNGLGDAEQSFVNAPPDGKVGVSDGRKLILCHPDGDGKVTTPAVTLSSSTTPPNPQQQHWLPYWKYDCQILDLRISCNGQDITNPKPTYQAKVGQNTALSFSGVINEVVISPSWNIPNGADEFVKDWIHSDASASVVHVPAEELTSTNIPRLFWVKGGNKAISFSATIYKLAVTLNGNINVDRPTNTLAVTPNANVSLETSLAGDAVLQLGYYDGTNAGAGVVFNVTPGQTAPPTLILAQVITNTTRQIVDGNNVTHNWSPTNGLDNFPAFSSDSPAQGVYQTDKSIYMNDSFDTWLMYFPSSVTGGNEHEDWIYVPLKKLSWNWSGRAVRQNPNRWVSTDLTQVTNPQAAQGTDEFKHPEWTQKASPPQGHFIPAR